MKVTLELKEKKEKEEEGLIAKRLSLVSIKAMGLCIHNLLVTAPDKLYSKLLNEKSIQQP